MTLFDTAPARFVDRILARFGADIRQVAMFGAVGITGTVVHYSVALLSEQAVDILLANIVGYSFALSVSYFGHQRFTFRVPSGAERHGHRVPRYATITTTGFLASEAMVYVTHHLMDAPSWVSLFCGVAIVPCITFIGYKYWVFAELPATERALEVQDHD